VLKEKAWDRRRWDQRIGCARCGIVSPIRHSLEHKIGRERNLEVSVPRHEVVPLLVGTLGHDPDERDQACFYLTDLFEEPETHVRHDLVVPRPTGVQFPP
jgi:hypothetical protein